MQTSFPASEENFPIVLQKMIDYVQPYMSAIGLVKPGDDRKPPGDHCGTGSFITFNNQRYILTCDHVATRKKLGTLGFTQFDAEEGLSIANSFDCMPYPVDAAASPLSENSWHLITHRAKCIDRKMLAQSHRPVEGEYLFIYGFAAIDTKTAFGEHIIPGTGAFVHEVPYDPALDFENPKVIDGFHICMAFNPMNADQLEGRPAPLPLAEGMSGSLVWNTRYQELTMQEKHWSAEDSRITAILWASSTKTCSLAATPIEHLEPLFKKLERVC